jgi:hypothetical protein
MTLLDVDEGAERVADFFRAMMGEIQTLARPCGKSNVHYLESQDLRADTGRLDDHRHAAGRDQ